MRTGYILVYVGLFIFIEMEDKLHFQYKMCTNCCGTTLSVLIIKLLDGAFCVSQPYFYIFILLKQKKV